jgi:uncharacterized protein involved in type VI secretion and phage assembly
MADKSGLLSHFYVKLGGANAPDDFMRDIITIDVESSLHLPDMATLVLHDTGLRWVDDNRLAPGVTVEVAAEGPHGEQTLFDGEIVELEPEFDASIQRLTVRAFDRLHRLARGRHVRTFQNVSDADLVKKLAREAGLDAKVDAASLVHPYLLQRGETNLEFLRGRALSLGQLLYVQGKTLHCVAPPENAPAVPLEWGKTMSRFLPRLTTIGQVEEVLARGWDPDQRRELLGQARKGRSAPRVGDGRGGGEVAKQAFQIAAQEVLLDTPIRSQATADQAAQAAADRVASRFIEAQGTCAGNPALRAGARATIDAVGQRFGGDYLVTAATHRYGANVGYSVEFSASGLHPATLLDLLRGEESHRPMVGLMIGVVTDNRDPDNHGRVKVKYPCWSAEHASDWARVVAVGGGPERGIEFLPEVNDEVLVGFEMGDHHFPYILGGLWNGRDEPPLPQAQVVEEGRVRRRVVRSRTGHTIVFDDENGGGGITIEDRKGNTIALDSKKDALTIEVKGDATVKARGSLTLQATRAIEIKGMGVKIDGGSGTVDVKGSLINLNS